MSDLVKHRTANLHILLPRKFFQNIQLVNTKVACVKFPEMWYLTAELQSWYLTPCHATCMSAIWWNRPYIFLCTETSQLTVTASYISYIIVRLRNPLAFGSSFQLRRGPCLIHNNCVLETSIAPFGAKLTSFWGHQHCAQTDWTLPNQLDLA